MGSIRIDTDVAFLDASRAERADLYRPAETATHYPIAVFLHGGAFHRGDKASERSQTLCRLLAESGVAVLSVNYLLSPGTEGEKRWQAWPTNLLDAASAVRFVVQNAQKLSLDASRIAVVGASAGGTLAMLLAFGAADTLAGEPISDSICSVVNFYGRVDWSRHTDEKKKPSSEDIARAASPLAWLESRQGVSPPVLTFHGDNDQVVPVEQARLLDEALRERGIPHELVILPGVPHAFALEPSPETICDRLTGFLATQLRQATVASDRCES